MPRPPLFSRAVAGLVASSVLAAVAGPVHALASTPEITVELTTQPAGSASSMSTTASKPVGGTAPGLGTAPPGLGSATAGLPPDEPAPLAISMDRVTPGALPRSGPILVKGRVTNESDEKWSALRLYPFFESREPMTTSAELAAAAATNADAVVGRRITEVQAKVSDLEPGESTSYQLRIPRRLFAASTPGVYWFGVHVLGASESQPDDLNADGRARTFLPYLPQSVRGTVETSIVVPLRSRIDYTQRGRLAREEVWNTSLSDGGILAEPVDFGSAANGRPMSWLLDPAVIDAASQLAQGNPLRSVAPTTKPDEDQPSESPTDPSGDATDNAQDGEEGSERSQDSPSARTASAWLERTKQALESGEVLGLPYGDLDMAGAAEHSPGLYRVARSYTSPVLDQWGADLVPAVASPTGYINPQGMELIDDNALILLTDRMFPVDAYPSGPASVVAVDGRRSLVTSYAASTGGPGPDPRTAAVALRQRVLSEAALRLIGDGKPLTVVVPRTTSSEGAEEFWTGLDQDWLTLTEASWAARGKTNPAASTSLDYPTRQQERELEATTFDDVDTLRSQASTLQNLLAYNDTIEGRITGEALSSVSYQQRDTPDETSTRLQESIDWVENRLNAVDITAPRGVTLSSDSGSFLITLTNRLKQPVKVHLEFRAGADVKVRSATPVTIGPESSTSIQPEAQVQGQAVHNVRIVLTDNEGSPLGGSATVPVRSGQVSDAIWLILGTGVGLLFLAIAIRLVRRIRDTAHTTDTGHTDDTATTGATKRPEAGEPTA